MCTRGRSSRLWFLRGLLCRESGPGCIVRQPNILAKAYCKSTVRGIHLCGEDCWEKSGQKTKSCGCPELHFDKQYLSRLELWTKVSKRFGPL